MAVTKKKTIYFKFSDKHKEYIRNCAKNTYNFAEGAVRAGKTVDNVYAFAHEIKDTKDKIHLATGSTSANAKLNIGDANGFGLEYIFRGQSHWGKYKGNECLYIKGPSTKYKQRIVIFAGGALANSYKKIRGNSYGMWIATEINLHHDNTIKEAFNRLIAANKRKIFWDLNPDNPNATIYTEYIDKYDKLNQKGELLGGYNYQHFTIDDNITISDERREEIKSQYDKTSIWYQRDILGKRCIAEGLIYRQFADNTEKYKNNEVKDLMMINVGVDFGGNKSGHSFVATGITPGYRKIKPLSSERHFGDIDPKKLGQLFVSFLQKILDRYGFITCVYCDSAEQVLIRGLRSSAIEARLGHIHIRDALKSSITDRIQLTCMLIAQDRFEYTDDCATLEIALCGAIWDPKELTENVRLDDGTSDIDTLDAYEYSIEKYTNRLLPRKR
ncbi:terminase large subunit domain-containing protein [Terrisporobacter glycolicus]|uniref:Phage terminase, large subunit, PBSX family n=1 Tax=Terrisporobacter glycolicus ATCC 14880 = DSM 1288 TaxID=1121315 RepID=A0ABZ2EW19_9FIRM|nr:terminase family protein [Terrisporobacter glycolicus]